MYILYIWENRESIVWIPKCLVIVGAWNVRCRVPAFPKPASSPGGQLRGGTAGLGRRPSVHLGASV